MEFLAREKPFPHVLAAQVLTAAGEAELLERLEGMEWQEWLGEFFCFDVAASAEQLADLLALPALDVMGAQIKTALALQLNVSVAGDPGLMVQRYRANSVIGFHTDELVPDLRFVLNLSRDCRPADGGVWVLANEPAVAAGVFLPPLSNTGFAFATGPNTFHALGRRSADRSYAIVMRYPLR